jgi:hypothetical protein
VLLLRNALYGSKRLLWRRCYCCYIVFIVVLQCIVKDELYTYGDFVAVAFC